MTGPRAGQPINLGSVPDITRYFSQDFCLLEWYAGQFGISQKTELSTANAVRTSNPARYFSFLHNSRPTLPRPKTIEVSFHQEESNREVPPSGTGAS
jgi:hypothetical protein